ncbi:desulfoferrodoxin FeS4 iron-binding domain-containing protein [Candidatus Dojkabacteria bacterium]|nr:desulfoferrodoxin FeS4 iron-binding domain-containing protein [Candidatus Dojkabacteria bacterium]
MAVQKRAEVFKCSVCGNTVEVVDVGGGTLVCCDKEMELLQPKGKAEEGKEKHVPVVRVKGCCVNVSVGTVPHPMETGHYIANIQLLKDGLVIAEKSLKSNEEPKATFCLCGGSCDEACSCEQEESCCGSCCSCADGECQCGEIAGKISARIYCNLHDLWESAK